MRISKQNNYIIIYYAILLLIMAMRTSVLAPNPILRIVYLLALFVPLVIKFTYLYLPCIITFMTVCTYNFAFGYLPYETNIYFFLSILALILIIGLHSIKSIKLDPVILFTIFYVAIRNILDSGQLHDMFYATSTIAIGSMLLSKDRSINRYAMLMSFGIISLVLSSLYLINYEQFLESYNSTDNLDRSGWTDPNYLSCLIGMGIVTSLILILKERTAKLYLKILWWSTIVISFISQVLIASRGGLLCVAITSLILILFADIKFKFKLFILIVATIFLFFLYNNNYFDLLIYRVENDVSGGSGRLGIWELKINAFIAENNILSWIFGVGYDSAFRLGYDTNGFGFHNDYLAILCGYGLVGVIIFTYLLFVYPFQRITSDKFIVISLVSYLAVTCLTLEPISAGRLPYIGFYALILACTPKKD